MKKSYLLVAIFAALSITSYADTFSVEKLENGKSVESSIVTKGTNFGSVYQTEFNNTNSLSVTINGQNYTTQKDRVNRIQFNANDKTLNLLIYFLNGSMPQYKALNEMISWDGSTQMDVKISPIFCNAEIDPCTNYEFIIKKLSDTDIQNLNNNQTTEEDNE